MAIAISPVNIEARSGLGIKAGDTVRVHQKIEEKGKTRLQAFEGLVLAVKHGREPGATFTVRRVSGGVGVEKIFPLYSPMIDKIEVVRRSKVRRAKLYYIREKVAKEIRRQMRNMRMMDLSTGSDMDEKQKAEADAKAAEESKAETDTQPQEEKPETEEQPKEAEQPTEPARAEEAGGEKKEENKEEDKTKKES